jgi:hypothetical protein
MEQVMEMSRREQDDFERAIALSLADTGRGGVGAGAGVGANDVEAQIIQQVMEMSRREQDEFERAMALSLADTGRCGVGAGSGVAANGIEDILTEPWSSLARNNVSEQPRQQQTQRAHQQQHEREIVEGALHQQQQTRSQTEFPEGWTQSQEMAYQKLIAAGTKQAMTTDLVRKPLKGEHGGKPSEIHQKSHIVDCELVVEALKTIPGKIPGRQYFAELAEIFRQAENWRWLKDVKNQPRKNGEAGVNDHDVVQKLLSGEKLYLSPHEASKVAKQAALLLKYKNVLPPAFVKSMVKLLDNAYEAETRSKILDRRKFPELKDSNSTSTPSKDSDRQQQQERERVEAARQRQQKWELARQQQQESERVEAARQQQERTLQQQQQQQEQEFERARNPWNAFQREHAGFGYTPSQMSAAYQQQQQQQQQPPPRELERAQNAWNVFQRDHAGFGYTPGQMSAAYQQQQQQPPQEFERAQNPWNVFQRDHAGFGYTPSQMSAAYHHGDGFRGTARHAVSSNPTGPTKADGTPDMRYKANRR